MSNLRQSSAIVVARLELRTLAEERDRLGLGQRRHRVLDLALNAQQLTARDQHCEVGTGSKQRAELRSRVDHLLEVVEQEQQLPLADVLGEPVLGAQRLGDRLRDERGVAEGG